MSKRHFIGIFFFICLFLSKFIFANVNSLIDMEIYTKSFAQQVFMVFSKPLYFEKTVNNQKMQLQLDFLGMDLKDFKKHNVVAKLKQLKGLVRNVEIFYKKVPSSRVVLLISFFSKDILVRWYKLEDSGKSDRLILDIFNKSKLQELQNKGKRLLYAKNDSKKKTNFSDNLINLGIPSVKLAKKDLSILIDAGHGGVDDGAKGFFLLKEKDIALDISRRASNLLKKNGFKVHLTRNGDQTLTLLERSELAAQLKADIFISIHVNAGFRQAASGIETYYLKEDILSPHRSSGFLFIFSKRDLALANIADRFFNNNIKLSKNLALSVHKSVLDVLKKAKIASVNRGLKQYTYRIFVRGGIPVILIEVGFLTNKQEARKLAVPAYRQVLARGISQGIERYIYSY